MNRVCYSWGYQSGWWLLIEVVRTERRENWILLETLCINVSQRLYEAERKICSDSLKWLTRCNGHMQDKRVFYFTLNSRNINSEQRHWKRGKSCRWLESTSEMSRTSLHYQKGLLKTPPGEWALVKRLQHSPTILCKQVVQEPHCFKRPCDTQKKRSMSWTHMLSQTLSRPG